ncbi:MAG: AsnC family transcriptional regulator, partial [Paenibacillus sp.]
LEQFIDDSMQYGTPSTNIVLSSYEQKVIDPFPSKE